MVDKVLSFHWRWKLSNTSKASKASEDPGTSLGFKFFLTSLGFVFFSSSQWNPNSTIWSSSPDLGGPSTRAPVGTCLDPERSVVKRNKTEGKINVAYENCCHGLEHGHQGSAHSQGLHPSRPPLTHWVSYIMHIEGHYPARRWSSVKFLPTVSRGVAEAGKPSALFHQWTYSWKHKEFFSLMILRKPWEYLRLLKCPQINVFATYFVL